MLKELDNKARFVLNNELTASNIDTKNKLGYRIIKRIIDIIAGFIGCICLVPIIIVIKLVTILRGDFNSIFFIQKRIGKDGKEFKFYKFRSMVPNADAILEDLLKNDEKLRKEYKKMKKLDNDPRITKIGNILRKTSLDELPQLINILLGDMSLVGNRPYLPREKEDMEEYFDDLVKTKPGLTGFWQVSLRSRGTFEQRMKMEKYYSEHCNLLFDLQILLKTFVVVLEKEGAK